jgi:prevent-host-death family protein
MILPRLPRTPDITTATDLRANLRKHLTRVKQTNQPLFITTNGETDAILVSREVYDALHEQAEFEASLQMIKESMADIEAGRVYPAGEALRALAKRMGHA